MPSKENPADEPSRCWESRSGDTWCSSSEHRALTPIIEMDLSQISFWPRGALFFLHFGSRREHDLCDWVEQLGALREIDIVGFRIDPVAEVGYQKFWFPLICFTANMGFSF